MATFTIHFHGIVYVEAETEEEAKELFFNDEEDSAEYEVDCVEEY